MKVDIEQVRQALIEAIRDWEPEMILQQKPDGKGGQGHGPVRKEAKRHASV